MRNIFVVNPAAGQGKNIDEFLESIEQAGKSAGQSVEVYMTKGIGDGEAFARKISQETSEEEKAETRIFACGGDGTLNEVVNGLGENSKISMGVIPIGTGNDFVRNFGTVEEFKNIENQLMGHEEIVDLIKYSGVFDGREQVRYCANMFNIGFDCNVVDKTAQLKTYPLLKGSLAYVMAVLVILIKKTGANLKVTVDGEVVHNGQSLLCAISNGSFCGGGMKSSPQAKVNDGLFDVNVVLNVSRVQFLKLFPSYTKGTHFGKKGTDKILHAFPCKKAKVEPLDGSIRLCTDGEIVTAGAIEFEMVHNGLRVWVPAK